MASRVRARCSLNQLLTLARVQEHRSHERAPHTDLTVLVKNLVDNAIRYTPAGGRVDLSSGTTGGRPWIRVEDTGLGIAREERERVFDPFYRVLSSDADGSGLGLSIVRTIAARLRAVSRFATHGRMA